MPTHTSAAREVIVIDMGVPDWQTLIAHLDPAIGVILLPQGGDGLASLALALADYGTLDALHIVSHGSAGQLHLGELRLNAATLGAEGDALAAIASHLAPAADVLLYGCTVAEGAAGAAFVDALSAALGGADVAASVDPTGAQALGGNWTLEYAHGQIETALPFAPFDIVAYNAAIFISDEVTAPVLTPASDSGSSSTDSITNKTSLTFTGNAPPSSVVDFYRSTTKLVSVTSDASGHWSTTVNATAGTASYHAGNTFMQSGNTSVTVDLTVPTVSIGSSAANIDPGASATITFTFSEALGPAFDNTMVGVSGGGTLGALTGSGLVRTATYTAPASGASVVAITIAAGAYQDVAGNNGTAGGAPPLSFGAVPNAPSTPVLATASDSGTSHTDGITNVTTPTLTGTATIGDTVTLYDTNGTTVLGSATAVDGTWSITSNVALSAGVHTLTAKAINSGQASAASGSLSVTIDTSVATLTTPDLLTQYDTGISGTDNITNAATVTISGTVEAQSTINLYDNGGSTSLYTVFASSGSWSKTGLALSEGTHSLTVVASDVAGNVRTSTALVVTVDRTAPTMYITSSAASLKVGETAIITFTFSEAPSVSFTWSGSAGDVVVTGGTLGAISGSGLTRTATFTPTASTNAGTASITVNANAYDDPAGNHGGAGTTPSLTFDTLAPAAPAAPALAAASDHGSANNDGVTNLATPTFTGTAESGATVTLYDSDGVTVLGSGSSVGGNWSITSSSLGGGAHTLKATATDAAGNVGVLSTGTVVTIDTTAPTVAITSSSHVDPGQTATITFTFSEAPGSAFTDAMVVVAGGGTLGALSHTGNVYTGTYTAPASGAATVAITVAAGAYQDVAGNDGAAGSTPALSFGTPVSAAPSTPALAAGSDAGASATDNITNVATPTFTGFAGTPGAVVTLYDTGGVTVLGTATAGLVDGYWSIASTMLAPGQHTITATEVDGANAVSAASPALVVTIDTTAPTLAITSSAASLKIGETATITFSFSEDPGSTFTWNGSSGDVLVTGGTLAAISGTGLTRTATFTPTAATNNGVASITVSASAYDDLAGNHGGAATTPSLTFDTLAPSAPSAPVLALASDTGTAGDNITTVTTPVITGTAEANAHLTLYDTNGTTVLGSATANGSGAWSITSAALSVGVHSLSVIQADIAGNLSPAGAVLALTIAAPVVIAPPAPPPLVDGVAVVSAPVIVAAGDLGTRVVVPVVPADRADTGGGTGVADVPLVTTSATTLLLAQVASGVGLIATGADSAPAGASLAKLIATINAVTPANSVDQQKFATDIQGFIKLLPSTVPLLIETVVPISAAAALIGALTLTGTSSASQHTALVIDASGLAPGSQLQLNAVDFAAVVGAVTVTGSTAGQILSGDAASQQFNVAANLNSTVFAGGGNDTLVLTAAAAAAIVPLAVTASAASVAPATAGIVTASATATNTTNTNTTNTNTTNTNTTNTVTLDLSPTATTAAATVPVGATVLHGGTGNDTAVFSGARAAYTLDLHEGYLVVSPVAAPQQKTLLVNVESIKFADTSVAVDNHAGLTTLAGLYQMVLSRQADVGGFDFWGGISQQGASLGQIALAMMSSGETLATHQNFNGNALHDLTLSYQSLFGRAVDSAGLAFWGGKLAQGVALDQVIDGMVHSPEFATHAVTVQGWNFLL